MVKLFVMNPLSRYATQSVYRLTAVALTLLFVLWASGATARDTNQLQRQLDEIVKRQLPQSFSLSLQVADLRSGLILMEKNPDLPLVPASTMKVVTTAAALKSMSPEFTFTTEVLVDAARGGTVGTLYLRGTGDPHLVSEQLFALTRALKDRGLEEIKGNIVVDDSYFLPGEPLDEQEKLGTRAYHAPYGALSLNFNAIKVVLIPGPRIGAPARIIVDPASEYAQVEGSVSTVKGQAPAQVQVTRREADGNREVFSVSGSVGIDTPVKGRYVNVSSPAMYAGEVFKEFLLREGIAVTGQVLAGKTPPSAESYLEFPSRPLGSNVYWLNKFSNNFMAEQISLALGAQVHGAPGTRDKGLAVIRQHLLDCGAKSETFALSEASGLSRGNRLSASALVKVLLAASKDFTYSAEFMASLGVAGVDGTLKEKFTDPAAKRRIRGKTGNLRGVNALTGYALSADGKPFAFACIVNNAGKNGGFIHYADTIVRALLDFSLGK